MSSQWQRSTTPTPLDDARAAQQRYRDHVKVCRVPAGSSCWSCEHLSAVAEGLYQRADHSAVRAAGAEQRQGVTA